MSGQGGPHRWAKRIKTALVLVGGAAVIVAVLVAAVAAERGWS